MSAHRDLLLRLTEDEADFWRREAEHLRRDLIAAMRTNGNVFDDLGKALAKSTARRAKFRKSKEGR